MQKTPLQNQIQHQIKITPDLGDKENTTYPPSKPRASIIKIKVNYDVTTIQDQITVLNNATNQLMLDRIIIANHHHKTPINVTKKEVIIHAPLVVGSYVIGGIAAMSLLGVSKSAAEGDAFNEFMYQFGSEIFNLLVNGYFFHLVLTAGVEALFPKLSPEAQEALSRLMNIDKSLKSKIGRWAKTIVVGILTLGPSFFASYASFYLDQHTTNHSKVIGGMVLVSSTILQHTGVKHLLQDAFSYSIWPFQAMYRKLNNSAMRRHRINQTFGTFKSARQDTWRDIYSEVLRLIQTHQDQELKNSIYPLLTKENPSLEDTKLLVFKLLAYAKKQYQPSWIGTKIAQVLSEISVLASLPGFYTPTVDGTAEFAGIQDEFQKFFWGSLVFLITVAISLVVGWEVGGNIYEILGYAASGIKKTWKDSASFKDFAANLWKNKFYDVLRLPQSVQQNPKTMMSLLIFFYGLSYFSTQASTYLNDQTLGKEISKYLKLLTIIAVMLFNAFPVDKILGSAQRFLTRLVGKEQSKQEIRLAQFIKEQEEIDSLVDQGQFITEMYGLINKKGEVVSEDVEMTIKAFVGGKAPDEIIGAAGVGLNIPTSKLFVEIVPKLSELQQELEKDTKGSLCRMLGFFKCCKKNNSNETVPLLENGAHSYGSA